MTAPIDISVIVPTYNRARVLDRALSSIVEQSFPAHEILIVDDGSEDDTAEVAGRYCDADDRIRFIPQQNLGPAAARNLGLKYATGNWVAFLDSDDWWSPHKLKHAVQQIDNCPDVEFIHANKRYVFEDGEDDGRLPFHPKDAVDRRYLLCHWAIKTSTVLIKRNLLKRIGHHFPLDLQSAEDYELFWRAIIEARDIRYAPKCDTTIVMTRGSIIRSGREIESFVDNLEACSRAARWITGRGHDTDYAAILRRSQYWHLRTLLLLRLKSFAMLSALRDCVRWRRDVKTKRTIRALLSACKGTLMEGLAGYRMRRKSAVPLNTTRKN